jgi:hypothetical protein
MPRDRAVLVTIYWRDIPAQVNAQVGRERHQILLPNRFQRAVDRAKRKARIYTSAEDIAQWRRVTKPMTGDPTAAAQAEVDALIAAYDADRIRRLVYAAGWEANIDERDIASISPAELAALEELDDDT